MRRGIVCALVLAATFLAGGLTGAALGSRDSAGSSVTPGTNAASADATVVNVSCPGDRDDRECRRQIREAVLRACYADRGQELIDVHIDATTLVTQGQFPASFVETERCADLLNPATSSP